jgi:hypothetical protein
MMNHLQIVAARGAAAALGPPASAAADPATEACATGDALECLVGLMEGGGGGGLALVGVLGGACAALAATAPSTGHPVPPWRGLAIRLVAAALAADDGRAVQADGASAALASAVPALADALYVSPGDAAVAAAAAAAAAGGPPAASDSLAAQLAAVHALARAFGLAAACPALDARLAGSARADAGGWPVVARTGLASLLRARAGAGARHATLAAAAGLASIAGPAWWQAPPPPRVAADPAASPAEFMRVLAEVLRVEATLGFRDAEAGGSVVVARPGGVGAASSTAAPAQPVEEIDGDGDEASSPRPPKPEPPPSAVAAAAGLVPAVDFDAAEARWAAAKGGAGPSKGRAPPQNDSNNNNNNTETAGDRAARVLPSVLALVEGALGALASGQEEDGEEEGQSGDVGRVPPPLLGGLQALPPTTTTTTSCSFPDAMAVRAFSSLQDSVEQALDYLELRAAAGPVALAADPLVPAAARSLGRLLADAPAAFGARPRALLPPLLGATRGGVAPFFLPVLALATALDDDEDAAAALDLDDGDRDAWLAAGRDARALAGLAGAVAAAARAACTRDSEDAALAAGCTVLAGLMTGRPATALREALPPAAGLPTVAAGAAATALSGWVGARLQAPSPAALAPPSDATTAAVAHALALILRADATQPPPADEADEEEGGDAAMADAAGSGGPAADAEAALVVTLQRGWAAAAVRAAQAGRASRVASASSTDDVSASLAAAAGAALVAWSRALVAGAAAVEARPALAAAAAAAPWVRELLTGPPLPPAAGGAALRLFLGTLRRVGAVPGGLEE